MTSAFSRRAVLRLLRQLGGGELAVVEVGAAAGRENAPAGGGLEIKVRDTRAYAAFIRGSVGAAEAYMQGWWDASDLAAVMRLLAHNMATLNAKMDGGWRKWARRAAFLREYSPLSSTRTRARENIAAHYDLGNEFFALFLDDSLAYSSAVFPSAEASLETASRRKLDLICDKLALHDDDHLLDLGCGWGALTFHAADRCNCRVTAITLSERQHAYVAAAVARRGLDGRVQVVLSDYRDFSPPSAFSKIASVEMIEAVGARNFGEYFSHVARFLATDGLALIQAILIPDKRFAAAAAEKDFISRYVFPGGALPSLGLVANCSDAAGLRVCGLQEIGWHYARTLAAWRQRFNANRGRVKALGFDEKFCRLWEYYLCYCEGGFAAGAIGNSQILLAHDDCVTP